VAIFAERDSDVAPGSAQLDEGSLATITRLVGSFRRHILEMDEILAIEHPAHGGVLPRFPRRARKELRQGGRYSPKCSRPEKVALANQ
jgi:hypothetical protein